MRDSIQFLKTLPINSYGTTLSGATRTSNSTNASCAIQPLSPPTFWQNLEPVRQSFKILGKSSTSLRWRRVVESKMSAKPPTNAFESFSEKGDQQIEQKQRHAAWPAPQTGMRYEVPRPPEVTVHKPAGIACSKNYFANSHDKRRIKIVCEDLLLRRTSASIAEKINEAVDTSCCRIGFGSIFPERKCGCRGKPWWW